jgi:uncharacterized membrane protein
MIEILPNWHPVFVHFTVALLIIAAAIHLLSHFLPKGELADQLTIVARWNLWFGVGFTLLTVAAGWYAFNTVAHDAPSHIAMSEHRNWAMATFALLLGIAGWEYYLSRHGRGKGWLFTALLAIAACLLLSTAWHGSELVYRYGLGVMSMPKAEGPGHIHEHGEGHGDMDMHGVDMLHDQDVHAHSHDDTAHDEHDAEPGHTTPAADGAVSATRKAAHSHASGTPPHKD